MRIIRIVALAAAAASLCSCRHKPPPEAGVATPSVTLNREKAPLGSPIEVTYRFDVAANAPRFTENFKVFVGFVDTDQELMWTDDHDPAVPTSQWAPGLRLGTAIVPAFTRGPALIAQSAAALAAVSGGRFVLGLGTSSDVIVERWNGVTFDRPYQRVRDTVRCVKALLAGGKVTEEYETFTIRGMRLADPPAMIFKPPLLQNSPPQVKRMRISENRPEVL